MDTKEQAEAKADKKVLEMVSKGYKVKLCTGANEICVGWTDGELTNEEVFTYVEAPPKGTLVKGLHRGGNELCLTSTGVIDSDGELVCTPHADGETGTAYFMSTWEVVELA